RAALAAAGADATVLLEPAPRDTAPAIALAAAFVTGADPNATLLILPADHLIRDAAGFAATVAAAAAVADGGRIVVFGVKPDRPATSYGYIKPGAALSGLDATAVAAFVEKPRAATATEFVAAGYLWNSGIFLMRAATALAEIDKHAAAIAVAAKDAVAGASADGGAIRLAAEPFLAARPISFDYAVMEKTDLAALVAAGFDWSDLGTWSAVWDAANKDDAGNAVSGDAVLVGTRRSYVRTSRPRVGVVGAEDIVVVASDDAVLVTTRQRADAVKDLVAAVEAAPEDGIGDFARHDRPWGHYQSLDLGEKHQVKRIIVNPGQRLSLQKHARRAEHWTVVEGIAEITVGVDAAALETKTARAGEHVHIPQGAIHRLANRGTAPMTLIEVQVGDYLGEDDIVRFEDDYGREEG
ncbi:MAG TPA: mannose-1-phosphate guanylyltransferase/mannose-6-phosphate isomerase, partial [Dongiaceae bacterium]|nr:mannose-1-phosphate guanylyltransferase/mannose-6-phosphate isomerase [Dongiaceae bacterium]